MLQFYIDKKYFKFSLTQVSKVITVTKKKKKILIFLQNIIDFLLQKLTITFIKII